MVFPPNQYPHCQTNHYPKQPELPPYRACSVRVGLHHSSVRVGLPHSPVKVDLPHSSVRVGLPHSPVKVDLPHSSVRVGPLPTYPITGTPLTKRDIQHLDQSKVATSPQRETVIKVKGMQSKANPTQKVEKEQENARTNSSKKSRRQKPLETVDQNQGKEPPKTPPKQKITNAGSDITPTSDQSDQSVANTPKKDSKPKVEKSPVKEPTFHLLNQRAKQVCFGLVTKGCLTALLLGDFRNAIESSPKPTAFISKRGFDAGIAAFRRELHQYDNQIVSPEILESEIGKKIIRIHEAFVNKLTLLLNKQAPDNDLDHDYYALYLIFLHDIRNLKNPSDNNHPSEVQVPSDESLDLDRVIRVSSDESWDSETVSQVPSDESLDLDRVIGDFIKAAEQNPRLANLIFS